MGNKPNNNDDIKNKNEDYFSLVEQTFRKHQDIINKHTINTDISFEKSFLNANNGNKKEKKRVKIFWKNYLLNFFKKRVAKGHEFYSDIIKDVTNERFGFERKFLSYMFYIDFEKTYNVYDKDVYFKKFLKNEKEEPDYETVLKSRLSRNSKVYLTQNTQNKKRMSFMNLPILEDDEEKTMRRESFKINVKRKQIINLIKIIQTQIENKEHPINKVISIFERNISSLIEDLKESYEKDPDLSGEKLLKSFTDLNETIISNILKFSKKIYVATKLFYSRVIQMDCFSEEKDELINIIMGILFNTGNLYSRISDLLSKQYKNDVEDLKNKLQKLKDLTPQDILIQDQFCLNEKTDELLKELQNKDKKGKITLYDDYEIDNNEQTGVIDIIINTDSSNKINKKKTNKSDKNIKYKQPYQSCIKKIREDLPKIKSPYQKMMLIGSLSTEINECIDNYWSGMDDNVPSSSYLEVNSDELLKIFIYIVASSNLPDIIIHSKIIQRFTFKLTKQSMIGFYISTLEAAISYVRESLVDDVKKGKNTDHFNDLIRKSYQSIMNDNNDDDNDNNNLKQKNSINDTDMEITNQLIGNEIKEDKESRNESFNICDFDLIENEK